MRNITKVIKGLGTTNIINPMTGYPADTNIKSITLIGDEGSKLDAYATGIFSMDISDVMKLLCKNNIVIYQLIITGTASIATLLSPILILAAIIPISIIWGRFRLILTRIFHGRHSVYLHHGMDLVEYCL